MCSKEEVMMQSLLWSIESMVTLYFSNVIFASQALSLIEAFIKPNDWPAFTQQSDRLLMALEHVSSWKLFFEATSSNRRAGLIALSALSESFSQSYVALSFP
ncbi:hypothetical protein V5N11_004531 [Cardamine amara subsp. amara]|uniref:Exportin-1/Importin-beta-like domain-containing protein n=1 Tax=Cardamine amara subsp. amara TaxID=228776 RepID=A0ABD1C432_CARAN